jgi:hypothetical protein
LPAIAWFLTLLILLFLPVLKPMVTEWMTDENMGHAFFVPLVAGYIVWLDREKIMAAPVRPYWPALVLVLLGFCQMIFGFLGADFFLARTAFLITIVGVIWTLAGAAVLRALAFPLLLLLFMIRIPLFVYQQITFRCCGMATSCSWPASGWRWWRRAAAFVPFCLSLSSRWLTAACLKSGYG